MPLSCLAPDAGARCGRAQGIARDEKNAGSLNLLSVPLFILTQTRQGVTRGFLVYLRISGIGYRASFSGQTPTLTLGHSHDCTYTLPPTLRAVLRVWTCRWQGNNIMAYRRLLILPIAFLAGEYRQSRLVWTQARSCITLRLRI